MRDMTAGELHSWYQRGQWPCGHGNEYIRGPAGGCSRNVQCPTCGMWMNVLDPEGGYPPMDFGQVWNEPPGYVPPSIPASITTRVAARLKTLVADYCKPVTSLFKHR